MDELDPIPAALKQDLKALAPPPSVPADIDAAIRHRARQQLTRIPNRRSPWWTWAAAGIAASLALTLTLLAMWHSSFGAQRAIADDVNGDGRVDIVDALILAQAVERSGAPVRAPWNRHRLLTRADADRIARQVVSLTPPPSAPHKLADHPATVNTMITACDLGPVEDRP